jgi:hypothetical protein
LSDTTGTITPTIAGPFVTGAWTGDVTINQAAMGITITATNGPASGTSNVFDLLAARTGTIAFNCWDDAHQTPVLATTTDASQLIPNDGIWTEFLYPLRGYPGVFAASGEAAFGLPVMRFHDLGIANGTYDAYAKLYTNDPGRNMRYYFGYTPVAPKAFHVDTVGGDGGAEQFAEYPLGSVTVSSGHFDIYVQDADLLGGAYPFFGWASIRLVPNCSATTWYRDLDGDGYGDAGTTSTGCTQPAGYVGNAGDCNDADGQAFGLVSEVTNLTLTKGAGVAHLAWNGQSLVAGPGTRFDIVTGFAEDLNVDGGFGEATCLANAIASSAYDDTSGDPNTPGHRAVYYLVRAKNSCGLGTFGSGTTIPDSRDLLDAGSPCP